MLSLVHECDSIFLLYLTAVSTIYVYILYIIYYMGTCFFQTIIYIIMHFIFLKLILLYVSISFKNIKITQIHQCDRISFDYFVRYLVFFLILN